jgi:YHS domain-containing protein
MSPIANVANATKVALNGYDPVSFFASGKDGPSEGAINGSHEITAEHNGITYYFSSNENRSTFEKNPKAYEPQMGGFCAFGVAKGGLFPADLKTAQIYKGKLYVNLNPAMLEMFNKDLDANIAQAEKNWEKLEKGQKPDA